MPSRPAAIRFVRCMAAGLLMIAAASILLVPFLSADRFREPLRADMETLLQRRVEFSELRFTLWGGPGFQLRNVTVAGDPGISAEPLAYVSEARVNLRVASLWRRKLLLARITLTQPSFNISQDKPALWHRQGLVPSGIRERLSAGEPIPTLNVEGGRINFRQGLRKSVYYFRNATLQLSEEGIGTDAWLLDFRAEPARTDSFAPRFGTVRGSGRWRPATGPDGELDLDVELERGPLAELAALFGLPQAGLSGYVTARAHLSGPASDLQLRGSLELRDFSSWSLFPAKEGERGVPVEGTLSLSRRQLRLSTSSRGATSAPYAATLAVFPPEDPRAWQATVQFQQTPAKMIASVLQYLDDSIPRIPALSGNLGGEIRYHSESGLVGSLESPQLTWMSTDSDPSEFKAFSLQNLQVRLEGDRFEGTTLLNPAVEGGIQQHEQGQESGSSPNSPAEPPPAAPDVPETATWKFSINRRSGELALQLDGSRLQPSHLHAIGLLAPPAAAAPPLLDGPSWWAKGTLNWRRDDFRDAGTWSGILTAHDLEGTLPGLGAPYRFQNATLDLNGNAWHLRKARGTISRVPALAELRYLGRGDYPYAATIKVDSVRLEELDPWFMLALPDSPGFLSRAFRRSRSFDKLPGTKDGLRAEIHIEKVLINSSTYSNLRADLYAHGRTLEFRNVSFESRFGRWKGMLSATSIPGTADWRCAFVARNEDWHDGVLEFTLQSHAVGRLTALAVGSAGEAEVVWKGPDRRNPHREATLRATLAWDPDQDEAALCEDCVELRNSDGVWVGSCNQSNGTGYRCLLKEPRTGQQLELELPMSMVGSQEN